MATDLPLQPLPVSWFTFLNHFLKADLLKERVSDSDRIRYHRSGLKWWNCSCSWSPFSRHPMPPLSRFFGYLELICYLLPGYLVLPVLCLSLADLPIVRRQSTLCYQLPFAICHSFCSIFMNWSSVTEPFRQYPVCFAPNSLWSKCASHCFSHCASLTESRSRLQAFG